MSGGAGDVGIAPVERGYHALRSEAWADMEAKNSAAMIEFQRQLALRNGGGYAEAEAEAAAGVGNVIPSEPVGDPHEALTEAKLAHAEANAKLARVKDALGRARDRADADEHALASFSGIDDRLTRLMAARAYDADAETDLPIAEQVALSARARGIERHELSQRALRYVEGELRTAEAAEQQTDRCLRAAASAVLMEQAAFLAREHAGVVAHEVELRARIKAYGDCNLPGLAGATPLPLACVEALNAPRVEIGRDLALEMKLREQHAAAMANDE